MKYNGLFIKITKVVMKVFEVLFWVATASMLALFIASLCAKPQIAALAERLAKGSGMDLAVYSFSLEIVNGNGEYIAKSVPMFAAAAFFIEPLLAMIFRNVYLILKKISSKENENKSPFDKDVIRMVREIGIFFIGMPVLGIIFGLISMLVMGAGTEFFARFDGLVVGLVILCLTYVFTYGRELEKDTEGLI